MVWTLIVIVCTVFWTIVIQDAKKELDKQEDPKLTSAKNKIEELNGIISDIVDEEVGIGQKQLAAPKSEKKPRRKRLPQIRSKKQKPNRTPCGSLCKHAREENELFYCEANRRDPCNESRALFEDSEGQCVMFERKKNY